VQDRPEDCPFGSLRHFEVSAGAVHFLSPFFLVETRRERRGRRVKPARPLCAPRSSRSEAERLEAAPALCKIAQGRRAPSIPKACLWPWIL
jgi:hypothetical protein